MPRILPAAAVTLLPALAFSALLHADEVRRIEGLSFNQVLVLGDFDVEISQADVAEVQLRGSEDDLDREPFRVDGRRLVLGKKEGYLSSAMDTLQVRVAMPELTELRVQGSGDVYLKPFELRATRRGDAPLISLDGSGDVRVFSVQGPAIEMRVKGSGGIIADRVDVEDIEAVVSGSGDLFIQTLQAKFGEFVVTGSGDLTVTEEGFVQTLEVNIVGSGDIRLDSLGSDRAEVNIVGSGGASIGEVLTQLNSSILGSGDVHYRGDPEVESVQLGSGEVRRRD